MLPLTVLATAALVVDLVRRLDVTRHADPLQPLACSLELLAVGLLWSHAGLLLTTT